MKKPKKRKVQAKKSLRRFINPFALEAQIQYFKAFHVTSEGEKYPPIALGLLDMLNWIKEDIAVGRECILELEDRE